MRISHARPAVVDAPKLDLPAHCIGRVIRQELSRNLGRAQVRLALEATSLNHDEQDRGLLHIHTGQPKGQKQYRKGGALPVQGAASKI